MQKHGQIIFRGTTPERWKPEPGRRLLYGLRESRSVKVWAEGMFTAPERGEDWAMFAVRSIVNQKPLRRPQRTTSLAVARRKAMTIRRVQKSRQSEPPKIMAKLPVEYV